MGHYGALIKEENGRYLLQDPALDGTGEAWVSAAALDAEASGYFLIPAGRWPAGWRAVGNKEGAVVWGRGYPGSSNSGDTGGNAAQAGGDPCKKKGEKMASYTVHAMLVSLRIEDTPVGYTPPRGPDLQFTVAYNQREANQPANFTYANLGPKWTFNWLSYITDRPPDPRNPRAGADATLYKKGSGTEPYTGFDEKTQAYALQFKSRARLIRTSPTSYERRLPDGTREIFDRPDGAASFPRKIFLTRSVDPVGNAISFTYDERLRLVAVADALGQVTTLSYELPSDPLKITRVADPFGRSARFEYDGSGRLIRITDVIGITSEFSYAGAGDFINALTTPYGTTRFTTGELGTRWLEATDPLGDTERVEYRHQAPGIPVNEVIVPSGIGAFNSFMDGRNTYYWNKKAWREHPGDYTRAKIFHWLHEADRRGDPVQIASGELESEKEPLENRVWYNYPGQRHFGTVGTQAQPSKIARVLDDGSTQLYQLEYNLLGNVTRITDPVGRVFSYVYAINGIDLLEVGQTRGDANETLARFTYNRQHQPLTATDAARQTTRFTYNDFGQLLTITNPRDETTTLSYDDNGYLLSIEGPVKGAIISFTYDGYGRVETVTDSEGYTLTFAYDDLDRLTSTVYPDGTFEQIVYNRLDPELFIDRLGRSTRRTYDARRRVTAVEDALNRVTRFEWCRCGSLEKIIDPLGRTTTWKYDVQGRIIGKVFPDGSETAYNYEHSTSRLQEVTDAKGQTTRYEYDPDNNLRQINSSGGVNRRAAHPLAGLVRVAGRVVGQARVAGLVRAAGVETP